MCTADEEEHASARRGHGPSRDCARGPTPWSAPSDPGADQLDGGAPRASTPRGCAPGRAAGSWWVCCWKSPLVAALRGGVAGLDSAARTRSRVGVPGVGAGIRDARHGGEFLSGVSAWGSSCCMLHPRLIRGGRGCSSMVELQLPKLTARVRFPSPAPQERSGSARFRAFHRFRHRASRAGPVGTGPSGRRSRVRATVGTGRPGGLGMRSRFSSQIPTRLRAGRDQEVSGTPRASTPQSSCPGRAHRMTIPSTKPHKTETGARMPKLSRVISNWATALPV